MMISEWSIDHQIGETKLFIKLIIDSMMANMHDRTSVITDLLELRTFEDKLHELEGSKNDCDN